MLKSFEQTRGRQQQRNAQNKEVPPYEQRFLQLIDKDPEAAFTVALENEDEPRCRTALEKGASIETLYKGWNRLHDATANGELSKVRLLCRLGANVNAVTHGDETPLLLAIFYKKFDIAEFLASIPGVDPHIETRRKLTAFKQAIKGRHLAPIIIMLKIAQETNECLEVLHHAIRYNHQDTIFAMLGVTEWTKLLKSEVRQSLLTEAIKEKTDFAVIQAFFFLQNLPFGVDYSNILTAQGKAHFDSVAKIQAFLKLEDPLSYLEAHQLSSPVQLAALRLVQVKREVKKMYVAQHEEEVEQHGEEEDAMADKRVKLSNKHYKDTVEPYVREKFLSFSRKRDRKQALLAVEKKIREFILEEIRKKAQENNQQEILSFIQKNKKGLINGTQKAMKASVAVFKALTDEQAAWRGYNPFAVVASKNWQNLLTACTEEKIYITEAAFEGEALSGKEGSTMVRERVAHYFLGLSEGEDQAVIADRMAIFILKLAEIRNTKGVNIPSCFPGTVTRIAQMGAAHDVLRLPPSFEEVLLQTMRAKVLAKFKEQCEKYPTVKEKEDFLHALVDITEHSAKELVQTPDGYPQAWLQIRQEFINSLGTEISIFKEVKQQVEWEVEDPEMILVSEHLVDVAKGEIAITLEKALDEILDSVPTPEEKARANPFNQDNLKAHELAALLLTVIETDLPFYLQSTRKLLSLSEYLKYKVPTLLAANLEDAQVDQFFDNLEGDDYSKEATKQRFKERCLQLGLKSARLPLNNPYEARLSAIEKQIAMTPHPKVLVQLQKTKPTLEKKRALFNQYEAKLKPCFEGKHDPETITELLCAICEQITQTDSLELSLLEAELSEKAKLLLRTQAVSVALGGNVNLSSRSRVKK